jgi:hypothetical protein
MVAAAISSAEAPTLVRPLDGLMTGAPERRHSHQRCPNLTEVPPTGQEQIANIIGTAKDR